MPTSEEEAIAKRRASFVGKQLLFFWPMVDNADDADRVARLNYWLCVQYAAWNFLSGLFTMFFFQSPGPSVSGVLLITNICLFFFLAANAVRRNSMPAAASVVLITLAAIFQDYALSMKINPTPVLIFIAGLMILRGTFLTARWQRLHGDEPADQDPLRIENILPLQVNFKLTRDMSDQWPLRIWPRLQWLFWIAAAALLGQTIFFSVILLQASQVK